MPAIPRRVVPVIRAALICCLLIACFGSVGFGPPVLTDGGNSSLRLYPEQVQGLQKLAQPPAVSAASALVVDLDSGWTLYALRAHEPLPPASTVKIMTALVVLQRAGLDERVMVSAEAAGTPGSRMGLVVGETLTVQDLLYGLLLPSGNDAAIALAEHVAQAQGEDAVGAFVALMNEAARTLGLGQTRFTNPHGLDDPDQVVSTADLVTMTRAALAYPAFSQIVGTQRAVAAGHSLVSTNELLDAYPAADGIKTGTTAAAGECLVASATRNGHRLLAVVLGSSDRYADARALLDYALTGWSWRKVTLPDNALAWEIDAGGHAYRLRTTDEPDVFLPAWQWDLVQPVRLLDATAALTGTLPVGSFRLMLDGRVLAAVPLTVWPGP